MKRLAAAAAAFALLIVLAAGAAPAQTGQTILFTFTGLRGSADECKWFNDEITDRSVGALTHQTDLLYNRIALPYGAPVSVGRTAMTEQGEQLVDFGLNHATICTTAEAVYGPTPSPSPS
jgi:hypothetical protein